MSFLRHHAVRLACLAGALLLPAAASARPLLADRGLTFGDGALSGELAPAPGLASVDTPCEGNNYANDNYLDPVLMGGPMVAISWVPAASVTVTHLEIFTGESSAPSAVAIWSDDGGAPSAPSAPLGFSAPFNVMPTNAWYGADLDVGVPVVAGQMYWVVWDPTGGEQCSCTDDPADIQQTYYGSTSGTVSGGAAWDLGPFTFSDRRWKFRMLCSGGGGTGDDSDGDGVEDDADLCPDTVVPELAPELRLGVNRWALVDDDGIFDTTEPNGVGPKAEFSIEDTRGCSCQQVIEALGIGEGHDKYGCSTGVMRHWISLVAP